ncbi:hypothetical protein HN681_03560 [archaeon]|jgi:hypothetical protein|nr:hypothetical protein [archaeon]MBT3730384.1 hypothetical protein [archaeon]MBT5030169.1 hypothetical protein [archaeon]MBT5287712.1 hypothetical protein [archaeon]MBT7053136.1 hypothetical protein [archaeon]
MRKAILGLSLGAMLAGCDDGNTVVLAENEYEGPVRIRLSEEFVKMDENKCKLEVFDNEGNLLASYNSKCFPYDGYLVTAEGVYAFGENQSKLSPTH